jgi:hypothetical protein
MPGKPKAQRLLSCHRLANLPEFASQMRSYNGFDLAHFKKCHRQGFVRSGRQERCAPRTGLRSRSANVGVIRTPARAGYGPVSKTMAFLASPG